MPSQFVLSTAIYFVLAVLKHAAKDQNLHSKAHSHWRQTCTYNTRGNASQQSSRKCYSSYLATCVDMALRRSAPRISEMPPSDIPAARIGLSGPRWRPTHNRRCAVWREMLVEHQSVPVPGTNLAKTSSMATNVADATYASLVSGTSSAHSGLGFCICSSETWSSALSLRASIQP